MKDIFGKALLDFHNGNYSEDLLTSTNISEEDTLPLPFLFRTYKEMPKIEKRALTLARGKILDVGCGAGSHSIYLQEKRLDVMAVDISAGAVEVAKSRGVKNVQQVDILKVNKKFDTILLLMNGTGIFQKLNLTSKYLIHLRSLLNPKGQILIDSSDIKYMYLDDDGGQWNDTQAGYYGELDYYLSYKSEDEIPMKWLYLDFKTLKKSCNLVGLKCELILEGEHYDYLARLSL